MPSARLQGAAHLCWHLSLVVPRTFLFLISQTQVRRVVSWDWSSSADWLLPRHDIACRCFALVFDCPAGLEGAGLHLVIGALWDSPGLQQLHIARAHLDCVLPACHWAAAACPAPALPGHWAVPGPAMGPGTCAAGAKCTQQRLHLLARCVQVDFGCGAQALRRPYFSVASVMSARRPCSRHLT